MPRSLVFALVLGLVSPLSTARADGDKDKQALAESQEAKAKVSKLVGQIEAALEAVRAIEKVPADKVEERKNARKAAEKAVDKASAQVKASLRQLERVEKALGDLSSSLVSQK